MVIILVLSFFREGRGGEGEGRGGEGRGEESADEVRGALGGR